MELSGLIVGLGNPGREYEQTRHNFGFQALRLLYARLEETSRLDKLSKAQDRYLLWRCARRNGAAWLLLLPLTFMNNSGDAVRRVADYYRLEPEQLLVLHDELDLPLGRMKMKKGGGNAGHNGLKSIQQHLGTPEFYRMRLGIGKPATGDSASWVLRPFLPEERKTHGEMVAAAVHGTRLFMEEGPAQAQRFCNAFTLPE